MTEKTELQLMINQDVTSAQALKIKSSADQLTASEMLRECNNRIKTINDTFDPIVKKAHETHKEATAQRKKHLDPVQNAKQMITSKISTYQYQVEKAQREEQARLQEIAQKQAEERQLAEAEALEKAGFKEESEAIISQKPVVEVVAPIQEKAPDGLSFRTSWEYEIIDKSKIPMDYLMVDEKKIGQIVRAWKGDTNINGVKVYSKKTAVQRT